MLPANTYHPLQNFTVIQQFEKVAERNPNHPALIFNGEIITYQSFNSKVNQFAHYLLGKGLKKGDVVNIVLQRSVEAIISIFAVLKCGATYVPIDAAYPRERVNFMVEDAGASYLITYASHRGLYHSPAGEIIIEDAFEQILNCSNNNPGISVAPQDAMYMIYTSGSTGTPKGAVISHQNIMHFLQGMQHIFQVNEHFRMSAVYSISFDPSGGDYFMALTQGATLVIADADTLKDGNKLFRFIKENNLTYFKGTPSLYKLLVDAGWQEKLPITMVSGGEPLPNNLAEKILPKCKELYNVYGPTECAIISTVAKITDSDNITIGKPLQNTPVYILNEDLKPVQNGEPGELYIGGNGVGLGYHRREDVTAKNFLPDTFSNSAQQKMYKTGDLAKYNEAGDIICLGRLDNQVKIRGYRIELGELEYQLSQQQYVKDAIVRARQNHNGENVLIAYVQVHPSSHDNADNIAHWRKALQQKLPEFMLPSYFFILKEWPHLPNGKIDYNSLPAVPANRPDMDMLYKAPKAKIEIEIAAAWQDVLGISGIGVNDNFFELGGNSLMAQRTIAHIKEQYQHIIPVTKLYQYPTIAGLSAYLQGAHTQARKTAAPKNIDRTITDIAIIGMDCNFPGATTIEEFWEVLKSGKETISFFNDEDIDSSIPDDIKNDATYVKARGVLKDVDMFDASFFGINPRLAELMDPQHRLFLQSSRNLLEKTGYLSEKCDCVTGVFVGCSSSTYFNNNVIGHKDKIEQQGRFSMLSVTDKDYISTRTAYHLNLNGPAVNVNSACSTSLLAVAQAVESLRAGQCEIAIAGGAAVHVPVHSGHLYQEGAVYSIDGHCRPFDANAKGTVFSDGVGAVLLKPLSDAERDGDVIYGVIKGIGINNDGNNKGSFSAPSAEGQGQAISMALQDAKVLPENVTYIEAHGTATPLGDPIEIEGLKIAFGEQDKKQYCAIGSVKSNMGHMAHAAGVAGLIKTTLALHHQQLPPSIHYTVANPAIDFANSPFVVNDELKNWHSNHERIAGVSSFGVGGTNVHVVLQEYASGKQKETVVDDRPQIITWSARNLESVNAYGQQLLQFAKTHPAESIANIAYTLQTTRQNFAVRNSIVVKNMDDFIARLSETEKLSATANTLQQKETNITFMFPGQGSQYAGMGYQLYKNEPVYKAAVDECAELLLQEMGEDIRPVIFSQNDDAAEKLKNTYYTQPAIFVTGYAIAKLYMSWGISPNAMMGHSVGEFVAAHIAGIFSLQDALKVVATRARLISHLPGGTMLSVRAAKNAIESFLTDDVSVAAINAPNLCVLSGNDNAIDKLATILNENGIANKPLRTSHAFHSAMMDEAVAPLLEVINTVHLHIPRIPILSTVTAAWMKDEEATSALYWAHHLRATVNFSGAVTVMENDMHPVFLETGPGTTTNILVKQHGSEPGKRSFSALDTGAKTDETMAVKRALGKLWQYGVEVNWEKLYQQNYQVLHHLPTYAFDKKRFWLEPITTTLENHNGQMQQPNNTNPLTAANNHSTTMKRKDILVDKLKEIFESASGIDIADANPTSNFTEIGLDSLLLTQAASTLKKEFKVAVTFRQLNEECDSLEKLALYLDEKLPANAYQPSSNSIPAAQPVAMPQVAAKSYNIPAFNNDNLASQTAISLISQQINLLSQQVALLQGAPVAQSTINNTASANIISNNNNLVVKENDDLTTEEKIELKKPFGATARIDTKTVDITEEQSQYLQKFIASYIQKTAKSKAYTQEHRSYMADPRVVSGFKPYTKEMVYSIVVNKSKGAYLWDIDGNKYIDALNGFGSNFLGYQPDVIKKAIIEQVENGYEIGPQHELAGEVSKMICEFTGFDRAALCNTGSEAVLGAMRIARTVNNKNLIVSFTGAYHGITDEALVRGTKKLKTFPAASGILQDNVQNMLVLEYGADASLQIIKERANDIAAVLIEPVQSRRPEFQPIEFLKQLRTITSQNDIALIFDEVITGFRSHPGGAQALFNVKADIGTYGKVVGGGLSIGVIAGKRKYMDALDGGHWQYGDASKPEVGITYFAGTFVRHPLVLATARASLNYMKEQGPQLQQTLNDTTTQLAVQLNAVCEKYGVPIFVAHFASLWRFKFKEEYPYYELLFAVMRSKGIHIWDGFSCFLTTAHTHDDVQAIVKVFDESVAELCAVHFIPQHKTNGSPVTNGLHIMQHSEPPLPGARLGKSKDGNAAWFIADENNPGKYVQINN